MKRLIYLIIVTVMASCVDDFTDANPRARQDAPTIRLSSSGESQTVLAIPVNKYQNSFLAYAKYGETSTFSIVVIDAPGKVASVEVTSSVPDFATVNLNSSSVDALINQTEGSFSFNVIPNPELPDESDRAVNIVVTVTDSQLDENGEPFPKITTLTFPLNLVKCISEGIEGTYTVTEAAGNLDGGALYTIDDLEEDFGGPILVNISQEFPGRFIIDEFTGGVWPLYYSGRARPILEVDLCGSTLSGHPGATTAQLPGSPVARTFTLTGILNIDGTIDIEWSYVRDDGPTPLNPASGSFTLTKN